MLPTYKEKEESFMRQARSSQGTHVETVAREGERGRAAARQGTQGRGSQETHSTEQLRLGHP